MEEKIALVTGGAGFIGRHLVHMLVERGRKVRVIDKAERPEDFPSEVEYIRGSIFEHKLARKSAWGVDEIYHLAAIPDLWAEDKQVFYKINTDGTRKMLDLARQFGIRKFVYTSSETVLKGYQNRDEQPVVEESPRPEFNELPGPYSRSKWLAEQEVMDMAGNGLPAVIVYPTTPVGPGDVNLTPPTRMIRDFLSGSTPAYLDCWFNLVPVSEVALGHIQAAEKGTAGDRFFLGNTNIKLSGILEILERGTGIKMPERTIPPNIALMVAYADEFIADKITGKKPKASLEGVRTCLSKLRIDNSKSRKVLELPKSSVEKALLASASWLGEHGYLDD